MTTSSWRSPAAPKNPTVRSSPSPRIWRPCIFRTAVRRIGDDGERRTTAPPCIPESTGADVRRSRSTRHASAAMTHRRIFMLQQHHKGSLCPKWFAMYFRQGTHLRRLAKNPFRTPSGNPLLLTMVTIFKNDFGPPRRRGPRDHDLWGKCVARDSTVDHSQCQSNLFSKRCNMT